MMRAPTDKLLMAILLATAALAPGCQCVWGIEDRGLRADAGANPDSAGEVDAALQPLCDPVAQDDCMPGQKCARHEVSPGMVISDCVPDGSKLELETCDESAPFDDCEAGLTCLRGLCQANCNYVADGCGFDFTCRGGLAGFPDQLQFGVCDQFCDTTFQQGCSFGEACFAVEELGQSQCRELFGGPILPQQQDPCFPIPGGDPDECAPNGCDIGFGPHQPNATAVNDCAFYCWPNNTHVQEPFLANGGDPAGKGMGSCTTDFAGLRPDGPGPTFQCRFLQTVHMPPLATDELVGICVDPTLPEWGDCTSECDAGSQQTAMNCPPGCLSQSFFDGLSPI